MQDLDEITYKLRSKLSCGPTSTSAPVPTSHGLEFDPTAISQLHQGPLTSTMSDMGGLDLPRSQRDTPRDDLGNTGSHGAESSRTAGDSGQFSTEKYDESAPTSQRSASERMDTMRSGVTPRDFLDSGYPPNTNNNSNVEDPEQNMWMTLSPRNDDEKKDEYSESGGFSFRRSQRDELHTPRDGLHTPRDTGASSNMENVLQSNMVETIQQHIDNAKKLLTEVKESNTNDHKQMSIIQEYSENDKSDSEDEVDNKYYHRYRDLLDNEQDESDKDENEEEEDEGEIVVPRRINDVSGKFSPTGEIIMLSEDMESPVPYERSSGDHRTPRGHDSPRGHDMRHFMEQGSSVKSESASGSQPSTARSGSTIEAHGDGQEDMLQDMESDSDKSDAEDNADVDNGDAGDQDEVPRSGSSRLMEGQFEIQFDEKDSWLSDSDKEEGRPLVVDSRYVHNQAQMLKQKHTRQDSDTGYSSRDNASESYLTPSAAGTNSETDMSRLHDNDHWSDQRESGEDQVFIERHKNRLLANVELESTGGSFGLRYEPGPSRISSAGSRQTRQSSEPSVTESFDEKEEQNYLKQELEPIESELETLQPASARSNELEDFFNGGDTQKRTLDSNRKSRTNSECSIKTVSDFNNQANNSGSQGKGDNSASSSRGTTPRSCNSGGVPNFFMPVHHLEESLRTLQAATSKVTKN